MEHTNILVSVIVPVYNPGIYFKRFLRSLQNQTLKDIEIIFVDDCSTDDSIAMIEEASKTDPRIRLIRNETNLGPGPCRNKGIELAQGQYLSFADPDDTMAEDMLEQLYKKTENGTIEIVKGNIIYLKEDGHVAKQSTLNDLIKERLGKDPLWYFFAYEHHGTLYKRSLVMDNNVRNGNGRRSQDTVFLLRVCFPCQSFVLAEEAAYYHTERHSSTMHTFDKKTLEGILVSCQEKIDFFNEHHLENEYVHRYMIILTMYVLSVAHYEKKHQEELADFFLSQYYQKIDSLPYKEILRKLSFPVEVLLAHKIALPYRPFSQPWHKPTTNDWVDLFEDWQEVVTTYYPDSHHAWIRFAYMLNECKTTNPRAVQQFYAHTTLSSRQKLMLRLLPTGTSIFSILPDSTRNLVKRTLLKTNSKK